MSRWGLHGTRSADQADHRIALEACREKGAVVTTEPFGEGRQEPVAKERFVVRYVYGTCESGDASCTALLRWPMIQGWALVIKERNLKSSKVDDVFVEVPGYPILFRGRKGLERRGLLPCH